MRTPKFRERADGTATWKVRYRSATGAQKSETFIDDEEGALEFCKLLDALGPARAVAYIDERAKAQGAERGHAYTIDDLFGMWIEWKAKRNEVRSVRTIEDYRGMYDRAVKPPFGAMPANLLSQGDVQHWIDNLPLAPKTVADYHSLLHAIYKWAFHPARGYVINDPCADTDLPKRRKTPPKGLRPSEWQILHRAALAVDHEVADLLLFMASTGWRFSECVALQAMAVDHWLSDDGATTHTYVTMGRVLRREGGHFVFVEDAKSAAGLRRVRLIGMGEEMVLRRLVGKRPTELLLTTRTGSRWAYTSFYERYWTRPKKSRDKVPNRKRVLEVARELGLDRPGLTPHWLRHTHVGMLILAGEPLTAIQRRLGHASIKTTSDTYGRMIEDASDAGLRRVAALLSGDDRPSLEG